MIQRVLGALVSLAGVCCAESRGQFSIVSSRVITHRYSAVYYPRVQARACFDPLSSAEDALEMVVTDALAKVPEANALALVEFRLEDASCFVVDGTPVLLK